MILQFSIPGTPVLSVILLEQVASTRCCVVEYDFCYNAFLISDSGALVLSSCANGLSPNFMAESFVDGRFWLHGASISSALVVSGSPGLHEGVVASMGGIWLGF